jgi:uncharacterized protein (TIGR03083 family)
VEVTDYVDAVDLEGGRLLDAARAAGLDASVPRCPGWTVRHLLAHVGFVHGWATEYVAGGITEMVTEPSEEEMFADAPKDAALFSWAADQHRRLVDAMRHAPADLECWTFLDAPSPLEMWARRQAHETTIHRVDAEEAAHRPIRQVDPAFAADGVDEVARAFLSRRRTRQPDEPARGTITLRATDHPSSWALRLLVDAIEVGDASTDGDLAVRATANDLYLLVWQRRDLAGLDASGDAGLWDEFQRRSAITWS